MNQVGQRYDEAVPVGKLRLHEQNANRGASGVIAESIAKTGFYGAIYAHEATGQIIAGNEHDFSA